MTFGGKVCLFKLQKGSKNDLLSKIWIFFEKMHILLNKSILQPFWSLNKHTFPPKVINNNYQSIIREYAAFFRMVEKYVCSKVMKKSWKYLILQNFLV